MIRYIVKATYNANGGKKDALREIEKTFEFNTIREIKRWYKYMQNDNEELVDFKVYMLHEQISQKIVEHSKEEEK